MSETRVRYFQAWRDVDSERRQFGVEVWLTGGQIRLGKRLYRCRWVRDVYTREAVCDHAIKGCGCPS